METLHQTNIAIHILFGALALGLGSLILILPKMTKNHRRLGRWFIYFFIIVITTAFIGSIGFRGSLFLLLLTIAAGYSAFSGYRNIQLKSNKLKVLDISVALLSMALAGALILYIQNTYQHWSPVVIYFTYGSLGMMVMYDLLRYLIKKEKYGKLWLYEHIYKMISALTALLAAASGNVLPESFQPESQYLPSSFGLMLAIGFILAFKIKFRKKAVIRPLTFQ